MTAVLLEASNAAIEVGGRELVSSIDLQVCKGQSLGIVGESGSGKSLTCRAFAGLLDSIGGRISRGTLTLAGTDLTASNSRDLSRLYGRTVSLVPQNSLSALNPLMRVGTHMVETLKALGTAGRAGEKARAADLLDRVGLRDVERVLRQYPHELSGGMRQRVMIALAIAGRPELLIADEPTTALDVSVQKEILELLRHLTVEEKMALILVSHDLGVVASATQSVAVMYGGMVVEQGPTATVLQYPNHPYTQALLQARPTIRRSGRLIGIPGTPATPDTWPEGCRFAPRCPHAQDRCRDSVPELEPVSADHLVACVRKNEINRMEGMAVGA
jgi:oligopeptide/dipeptide ABC transporter ATP-binding protein